MERRRDQGTKTKARRSGLHAQIVGNRWHARGTVRAGEQSRSVRRSLGLPAQAPREDAERAVEKLQSRIVRELLYGKGQEATFAHACSRYLKDRRQDRPSNWVDPELRKVTRFLEIIRHTKLSDIDGPFLQRVMTLHFGRLSPASRGRMCSTLGGIFAAAIRHGLMSAAPPLPRPRARDASLKTINKWIELDDVARLIRSLPECLQLPMKMVFLHGRRPGEILFRNWEDLDLTSGRERLDLGVTKAGKAESIALHRDVVIELKQLISSRAMAGIEREGRIFLNAKGEPWTDPQGLRGPPIDRQFKKAANLAANELEDMARAQDVDSEARGQLMERADFMRTVTAYNLRHAFVSHQAAIGTSPINIAAMVGWNSLAMLRRYAHVSDSAARRDVQKVSIG